jgi:hypothetical protein
VQAGTKKSCFVSPVGADRNPVKPLLFSFYFSTNSTRPFRPAFEPFLEGGAGRNKKNCFVSPVGADGDPVPFFLFFFLNQLGHSGLLLSRFRGQGRLEEKKNSASPVRADRGDLVKYFFSFFFFTTPAV